MTALNKMDTDNVSHGIVLSASFLQVSLVSPASSQFPLNHCISALVAGSKELKQPMSDPWEKEGMKEAREPWRNKKKAGDVV